jgi:hypothetical protein
VKNSKNADFFGCKSLKIKSRDFAITCFLTAPKGAGAFAGIKNNCARLLTRAALNGQDLANMKVADD